MSRIIENMNIEYEEITIKIPKDTLALTVSSVFINDGYNLKTETYGTDDIEKMKK